MVGAVSVARMRAGRGIVPVDERQEQTRPEDAGQRGARRAAQRDSLFLHAAIRRLDSAEDAITVRVRNLSPGGMMAELGTPFMPGERVTVDLRGVGTIEATVRWREAGRIGIAFDSDIEPQRARKTVAQRAAQSPAAPAPHAAARRPRLFGD